MFTCDRRNPWARTLAALLLVAGCRSAGRIDEPTYCELESAVAYACQSPMAAGEALPPVFPDLGGPRPVDQYVQFALGQNPAVQAARMRVRALAYRVPQAASLPDPMLNATLYAEPIQTAAGQQEFSLGASQKVPWFGKLATGAALAEQDVQAARAELAAAELDVVEKVKRAYYELYFAERAHRITEESKRQLQLIQQIVDRRYRVERKVTQQDLLRVQVELAQLESDLIRLGQQQESARARLARQLHVSPETPLNAVEQVAADQVPRDIESLYRRAVVLRPELHAALAAIQRDRVGVAMARLNYFPDVTLGLNWIDTSDAGLSPVANGRDALLVTAGVNLPVYRKRLDAGVREAESKAVASARQYDAAKDQTVEEVKDLFAQATSQEQLLSLFREDILPKAEQTLQQSIAAYAVGQVDILQLVDNWRQLLRFYVMQKQLESQLGQSLAALARVVGTYEIAAIP